MYCKLSKGQAFPLAFRVSSQSPKCFIPLYTSKPQAFVSVSLPNHISYPSVVNFSSSSYGFSKKTTHQNYRLLEPASYSVGIYDVTLGRKERNIAKPRCFSSTFYTKRGMRNYPSVKFRWFSSLYSRPAAECSDGGGRVGKNLPWLAARRDIDVKSSVKLEATKMCSSWEESAEKFLKNGNAAATESMENRSFVRRNDYRDRRKSSEEDESEKFPRNRVAATTKSTENRRFDRRNDYRDRRKSSEEDEAEKFLRNGNATITESRENRRFDRRNDYRDRPKSSEEDEAEKFLKNGRGNKRFDRRNDYRDGRKSSEEDEEWEENEEGNNPRWDKIRSRFQSFDRLNDDRPRLDDGPKSRTWSKQENWGKKTLKEAVESRTPKIVGEGIYGVGPVLAALSAGRREFYALHVQEGLDLSSNNRKKKDKKGFEKVLKIADKLGISRNETSKHDLNVFTDNRPHQGLVLDASPLEMVNIQELDRVSSDGEAGPLWVALDEVTDPQNLGAIIRSAYFFGVSGVVLCAKNSAPLSGVVSKASAGALELTELRSCKNMMQFLVSSAENGWRVLGGSVSSKAVPLNEVGTGKPTILVLGNEGTGLRPLVERSCTELIKIPGNIPVSLRAGLDDAETGETEERGLGEVFQSFMAVESLNVSVAAGVLLHHLVGTNSGSTSQLQDG